MNIRPLGDRGVVKPAKIEEKTQSGIILPGSAQEKPFQGTVVAAGPGARNEKGEHIAMDLKVGDRIVYDKVGGVDLKFEDQEFIVVSEKDVLVVLD